MLYKEIETISSTRSVCMSFSCSLELGIGRKLLVCFGYLKLSCLSKRDVTLWDYRNKLSSFIENLYTFKQKNFAFSHHSFMQLTQSNAFLPCVLSTHAQMGGKKKKKTQKKIWHHLKQKSLPKQERKNSTTPISVFQECKNPKLRRTKNSFNTLQSGFASSFTEVLTRKCCFFIHHSKSKHGFFLIAQFSSLHLYDLKIDTNLISALTVFCGSFLFVWVFCSFLVFVGFFCLFCFLREKVAFQHRNDTSSVLPSPPLSFLPTKLL